MRAVKPFWSLFSSSLRRSHRRRITDRNKGLRSIAGRFTHRVRAWRVAITRKGDFCTTGAMEMLASRQAKISTHGKAPSATTSGREALQPQIGAIDRSPYGKGTALAACVKSTHSRGMARKPLKTGPLSLVSE